METEYDPDLTLIVEADQADVDRLDDLMLRLEEDAEELGAIAARFTPLLAKLPGNKATAVTNKLKRAKANQTQFKQVVSRLMQRKPARTQACKAYKLPRRSPITRQDIVGRVQTPSPLFAVLTLDQGALSASIRAMSGQNVRAIKAFHKGIDDDGAPYGIDVPIDRHRTNLITGGALPDGHTFIGHGIEVDVQAADRSEPNPADLRIIGEALVRWGDRNGSNMVSLARVAECPPTTGVLTAAGGGNELGVRFAGPPFRSSTPLFSLKHAPEPHPSRPSRRFTRRYMGLPTVRRSTVESSSRRSSTVVPVSAYFSPSGSSSVVPSPSSTSTAAASWSSPTCAYRSVMVTEK